MTKERRLGRGLEALLGFGANPDAAMASPDAPAAAPQPAASEEPAGKDHAVSIEIGQIDYNPFQPRKTFRQEEIDELSRSLAAHGMIQPVVVRAADEGRYQLIAGERRLRAATQLGWTEVPTRIFQADDRQMAEVAIVENLQRKDLDPLEKAAAFQDYLGRYGCSQEDLAARIGIDRSTVANFIRLLELPNGVRDALHNGAISAGHARALLPLGDEHEQVLLLSEIQGQQLSVRQTEERVREAIERADHDPLLDGSEKPTLPAKGRARSSQLVALEQEFRMALGTKVDLRQTARGRGRLVIHFKNDDEFERIRETVCGVSVTRAAG